MTTSIEIKAADVQKLRLSTGAGLMDCKKALTESAGDMDKAIKILREKGIAKSSKRADRVAGEGVVDIWVSSDQTEGIIFELNCETDFVARNDEFVALSKKILGQIKDNPSWTSIENVPTEPVAELSAKIGEKIDARRFARAKVNAGIVSSYIHAGSKLGVLLAIESNKAGAPSEGLKELAREIALQIAGATPTYIQRSEVPTEIVDREKEIAKKQMEGQKKPAEILEKIALGKLDQFFAAHCLLEQPHVRDTSGKTKIQDLIEATAKKEGVTLSVKQFFRFRVGAE